jgi:exosortase/archaeosortase
MTYLNGAVASSYISMQPASGDMIIEGVKSTISHQWMAHLAQALHRLYCSITSTSCDKETYTAEGLSAWIDVPFKAAHWLFAQDNAMLQIAIFVPTFCLLVAIGALEALVVSPVTWTTALALLVGLSYYYFSGVKSKKSI